MLSNLPKEIVHIILSYDGKIKYRNGVYVDQIDVKKYEKVKQNIQSKINSKKTMNRRGNSFYVDVPFENTEFGVIYDNKWYGTGFVVSFYKDIEKSLLYKIKKAFYTYLASYFITNHEYV